MRKAGLILAAVMAGAASAARASESASATITLQSISGSTYNYELTLNDTGTTNIGTFWYAWVPGQDFLPSSPTAESSPSSWTAKVTHGGSSDGYAIQWVASGSGALTPGSSLSGFEFSSPDSPSALDGDSPYYSTMPVQTSVVYSGGPFSDSGAQFVAGNVAVPEPVSVFALFPMAAIILGRRRRTAG